MAEVLEGPGQGQVVRLRGRGQDVVGPLRSLCGTHAQTLSRQPEPHHFRHRLAVPRPGQLTRLQEVWSSGWPIRRDLEVPADPMGSAPFSEVAATRQHRNSSGMC